VAGGENIREMLAGFNAMQAQLGLLPPQTAQMPMGVQVNQPPPPPPVMHPGQFASMAVQQHQSAFQNTMQFSQMTRAQPPPSSPVFNPYSWGPTAGAAAGNQFNPQVANFMSGGQAPGMPSPIFSTAPQFGMYRPQAQAAPAQPFMPNAPHIFNPMAMPGSMFQPQYMRDFQINRAQQGNMSAMALGGIQGGFEIGGGIAGGAIGGFFGGGLGEMAGNWLGTRVGRFAGNAVAGTIGRDMMRGMQLQNTTAPFMVGGAQLDPFTGQGLSRQAGIDTAVGLRRMGREHDFARQTGFNTADIMGLTQGAADQGLLATAQGSDDIVRRMREVSKAIRVITQITGDPDVKAAMRDLGNMRNLGFQGLPNQMGALNNRAMFARMAGVSQSALEQQFGMPGALMAQGVGLAGATGYSAGIAGAGMANVGISGGAFNDLQLSRAGGRQGVAQTLALSQIGAMNQDLNIAASLTRRGGRLDFDQEQFNRTQRMSPGEVAAEASRRMGQYGIQGGEWRTRLQEFKDRASQGMTDTQRQLSAMRQVENYARSSGLGFGAAAIQMFGGDVQQARSLELLHESPGFYTGMEQQLRVQERAVRDRRVAERAQFRQPGLLTRMGRGISDAASGATDWAINPIAGALNAWDANAEENTAFGRGDRMTRNAGYELVRDTSDLGLARQYIAGGSAADLQRRAAGRGGEGVSTLNEIGSMFNTSVLSDANRRRRLGLEAEGYGGGTARIISLFGGRTSERNLTSVGRAGRAASVGIQNAAAGSTAGVALLGKLQQAGSGFAKFDINTSVSAVAAMARSRLDRDGTLTSGSAMTMEQVTEPWIEHLKGKGYNETEARRWVDAHQDELVQATVGEMYTFLDDKGKRAIARSQDIGDKIGSSQTTSQMREVARQDLASRLSDAGMGKATEKEYAGLVDIIGKNDSETVARAALRARQAMGDQGATKQLETLNKGKDQKTVTALNRAADMLYTNMDEKNRTMLTNAAATSDFATRMRKVQTAVGGTKFAQAVSEGLRTTNQALGMTGENVDETLTRLQGLDDDALSKAVGGNQEMIAAVKAFRKDRGAGRKAALQALVGMGGTAETEVRSAGADEGITRDIADLREMRKRAGGPQTQEEMTNQIFSDAVLVFAQAAKDLKAHTDGDAVAGGNPQNGTKK
jgi:hypothetical protein